MLNKFGSRLMALHLQDNNGSHKMHGLPMDGSIDWEMVMESIEKANYKGHTALEPMKWDYDDLSVEAFLRIAYKKAHQLDLFREKINSIV